MFSKKLTTTSTGASSQQIKRLKRELETADAIVIGAGAGLSTSAGFTYSGPRFREHFADFQAKYGITDMYAGGFFPFETEEERWAWWSRMILVNRYEAPVGQPYLDLLELVMDKDYFVLTTNVDHQFQRAGFDRHRLFYTQGDYGLFQCSEPCHNRTYDNEDMVRQMAAAQVQMKIPTALIPKCPVCGKPMMTNLRSDDTFVEDKGWHMAAERYTQFIKRHENLHVLFLELGVGGNTPGIIKLPFWQMTAKNPHAVFATVNKGEALVPNQIAKQSICIDDDIGAVLRQLLESV